MGTWRCCSTLLNLELSARVQIITKICILCKLGCIQRQSARNTRLTSCQRLSGLRCLRSTARSLALPQKQHRVKRACYSRHGNPRICSIPPEFPSSSVARTYCAASLYADDRKGILFTPFTAAGSLHAFAIALVCQSRHLRTSGQVAVSVKAQSFAKQMFEVAQRLQANGQKEQKVLEMVLKTAPSGDPQAVIDVIDNYAWSTGFLMNIGDRKGAIMEAALHRCQPKVALELGGYIGYSAMRIARNLPPGGKLYSIDPNENHVRIARRIIQHAGLSDKVEVLQSILEKSIQTLHQQGIQTVDFALIDHVKHLYLKDLLVLQKNGFLRKGSVVVGDNVLTPGSPEFRQYLKEHTDDFATTEHVSNLEYSNYILDIVTESVFRGKESMQ